MCRFALAVLYRAIHRVRIRGLAGRERMAIKKVLRVSLAGAVALAATSAIVAIARYSERFKASPCSRMRPQ
jgi:hypothetical protein